MEPEHPNEAGNAVGPGGARGHDTNEWLIDGVGESAPEPAAARAPRRRVSASAIVRRLGAIEAAVEETRVRAIGAEERAEEALGRQQALRAELDTLREEIVRHEEIAREEAIAVRRALAETGLAYVKAPSPPAVPVPVHPVEGKDPLGFNRIAGEVEERMQEIEHRVAEADETVRTLAPKPDSLGNGASRPPRRTSEPPPEPQPEPALEPEPENSLIDVNRIGFEQLREIGLSVTQAARLLARRDSRGEYSSLDQLDDLLDFPHELIDRLKRSLRIG